MRSWEAPPPKPGDRYVRKIPTTKKIVAKGGKWYRIWVNPERYQPKLKKGQVREETLLAKGDRLRRRNARLDRGNVPLFVKGMPLGGRRKGGVYTEPSM